MSAKEKGTASPPTMNCPETVDKGIKQKESLLKFDGTDDPGCDVGSGAFSSAFENKLTDGSITASGEVATAIAESFIGNGLDSLKIEELEAIRDLLQGSRDSSDAYQNLNNCISLSLLQETTDLSKTLSDLTKASDNTAKKFSDTADKIKKSYDGATAAKTAVEGLKACAEKVCTKKEEKDALSDLVPSFETLQAAANVLESQAKQAVMAVVQAASVFALSNISALESSISYVKGQSEQFKKDIDSSTDTANKKVVEWQKKYNESVIAQSISKGNKAKLKDVKLGKEQVYCFLSGTIVEGAEHKQQLWKLFEEAKDTYKIA